MSTNKSKSAVSESLLEGVHSRRKLLRGAALAGMAAAIPFRSAWSAPTVNPGSNSVSVDFPADEAKDIQTIIQAQGQISNGVLTIGIDREDLSGVTIHGVPVVPSFQIDGSLVFQSTDHDNVIFNGDIPLKSSEVVPFLDQLLAHGLIFQAEHQHFYDMSPVLWFIHFRMEGEAEQVAAGIKAALNVTSIPFPQTSPPNPTSPLPAAQLGKILGGPYTISSHGVVTVDIPREDGVFINGRQVNPFLNVQTNIEFMPYGGGHNAAAAPDFGMTADEIQKVVKLMRHQGWDVGCLYNQETAEYPQLYFSHMFKTGDSLTLAREIRRGLDLTDVKFS